MITPAKQNKISIRQLHAILLIRRFYIYYYALILNRLTKVIKTESGATATSEFKYDPFGRRIEKKITENGSTTTTKYIYDNEDIILEYDENRIIGNSYVHGPGIDEPLAVTTSQGTYYYHADGLGSIVALTDSTGKAQQTYEYDSFGNLKDQKNKIKQPYTYTGREWDKEAGLYYYRARYYDAKTGRFVSFDPILHPGNGALKKGCSQAINYPAFEGLKTNPQKLNPFVYVQNNPINYVDPSGQKTCYTYNSIPSDIIQQIPASILTTIQNSCFKFLGCQCCLGVYLDIIGESYVDGIKVRSAVTGGICKECSF